MLDDRWLVAHHEAAHAMAAAVLGEPVYSISIYDDGCGLFRGTAPTSLSFSEEQRALQNLCSDWRRAGGPQDRQWVERKVVICLSGAHSDRILVDEDRAAAGCGIDYEQARNLIGTLPLSERQQEAAFKYADERAGRLVRRYWQQVRALATYAYCSPGQIFEAQIREVLRLATSLNRRG